MLVVFVSSCIVTGDLFKEASEHNELDSVGSCTWIRAVRWKLVVVLNKQLCPATWCVCDGSGSTVVVVSHFHHKQLPSGVTSSDILRLVHFDAMKSYIAECYGVHCG